MKSLNIPDWNSDSIADPGCLFCGRPLKHEYAHMLHLLPDGTFVDDKDDPIHVDPSADLGYWSIGPTCYQRFLREAQDETKDALLWRLSDYI